MNPSESVPESNQLLTVDTATVWNNRASSSFSNDPQSFNKPSSFLHAQYPPLTRDRLKKKNMLDTLLHKNNNLEAPQVSRRRSISNGNISRRLYNDDNTPIIITNRITDQESSLDMSDSDTSILPLNSATAIEEQEQEQEQEREREQKQLKLQQQQKKRQRQKERGKGKMKIKDKDKAKAKGKGNRSIKFTDSHLTQDDHTEIFGSFCREKPYTEVSNQQCNTCWLDGTKSSHNHTRQSIKGDHQNKNLQRSVDIADRPSRGFSEILEISFSHLIKNRVSMGQFRPSPTSSSIWMKLIDYITMAASRVSDARSCEPISTRPATEDMLTLLEYSKKIFVQNITRYNLYKSNNNTNKDSDSSDSRLSNPEIHNLSKDKDKDKANVSLLTPVHPLEIGNSKMALRTLPNNQNLDCENHLPDSQPLVYSEPLSTKSYKSGRPDPRQDEVDPNICIHFEGWSCGLFGPKSKGRTWLWKIIGSSFEALAKIIVYGFVLTHHSTSWFFHTELQILYSWFLRTDKLKHFSDSTNTVSDSHTSLPAFSWHLTSPRDTITTTTTSNIRSKASVSPSPVKSCINEQVPPWIQVPRSPSSSSFPSPPPSSYSHLDKTPGDQRPFSVIEATDDVKYPYTHTSGKIDRGFKYVPLKYRDQLDTEIKEGLDHLKVAHSPYLRRIANFLDFVALTFYWIGVVCATTSTSPRRWSLIQGLSSLRILRFLVITKGTSVIMQSLQTSFDILCNVVGFFAFFMLLFSLLGLFLFTNSFSRRCAVIPDGRLSKDMTNITYVNPRTSCNSYYDLDGNRRMNVYDINIGEFIDVITRDGYSCQSGQICLQDEKNRPGWTYISYSNIFYTMLNIFTVISTEGWTDLMYMSQDAISSSGAVLYYCCCIYFMTFVIVPMFIAVITTSFSHARCNMRQNIFSSQYQAPKTVSKSMLEKNGETNDFELHNISDYVEVSVNPSNILSYFKKWLACAIESRYFLWISNTLVVANVITMSLYTTHLEKSDMALFDFVGRIFTFVFTGEIILRIAVYIFPRVLKLLASVISDGQGIRNLTFFTFLVLFLLCPISMQLFGGDFVPIEEVDEPGMRFDNFYQAFLSLFQIMTGENWTRNTDQEIHPAPQMATRILPDRFNKSKKNPRLHIKNLPQSLVLPLNKDRFKLFCTKYYIQKSDLDDENLDDFEKLKNRRRSQVYLAKEVERKASIVSTLSSKIHAPFLGATYDEDDEDEKPLVKYGDEYEINVANENKDVILENLDTFKALFLFDSDNIIRKSCIRLSSFSLYQWTIMGFICASAVLSVWTDEFYRQNEPRTTAVVEIIQHIFLGIFWIDFLVQVIADSLIVLPEAYLRKGWNIIDLLMLLGQTVCSIFLRGEKRGKCLRILRTLRSIRIMYYVSGMRVIFLDLVHVFPKLFDAVTLNLLVFIPFAIYGSYIFGGRFLRCNDDSVSFMVECHGEYRSVDASTKHITLPRVWHNPYDYSFDNFGNSLLHLFECASGEGWVSSVFSAMSVPIEKGAQPRFDWNSPSIWYSLYYICFMFLASLCSIQLFIGVFLEIFKQRSGISSLTIPQRQYRDLQRQLALMGPLRKVDPPLEGSLREFCYKLIAEKDDVLYILFFVLYSFEALIKLIGLGYRKWASTKWNIFDAYVLFLIFITMIAKRFTGNMPSLDIPYKLLLVAVAFRLAKRSESLDTLLQAIQKALPSIIYVTTAFFIVVVCFAVVFQEVFASTRYGPYGNPHINFRSLKTAMLTLFRMTTGENWDFLMRDFSVTWPNCVDEKDCGSPTAAFTLFIVISNFSFTFDKHNQFTLITRSDLRSYKQVWAEFDPRATGYIRKEDVPGFLRELKGTLSIHMYKREYSIQSLLEASDQMDADLSHLASVPLSESRLESSFGANNILGEKFYNFYKVNQRLGTMDMKAVQERKKAYNLVYQEIMMVSTRNGISFHHMLEILALRLVDINRSLTFDKLVYQTRRRQRVLRMVANEKIKNLVSMFILRRRYLQKLQEKQVSQVIDVGIFDNWKDGPDSHSAHSSQISLVNDSASMDLSNHNNAPKIVIDEPGGCNTLKRIPSQLDTLLHQRTFRQPARLPTESSSPTAAHSVHTCVEKDDYLAPKPGLALVGSESNKGLLINTKGHRKTISLHCWPRLSVFPPENSDSHQMPLVPESTFEKYYTMDLTLESMTTEDAMNLTDQIKQTKWADMLTELDN
ncbi:Ion transport protein-domain-containing protein [Phycomyces blakesleeanus]|uniref:Ion transport protein-domain-containing protein n=1 Tax=Phycomyces blakesleeanus TaxID=4837 RepID=A0ABR3B996_PHYBL